MTLSATTASASNPSSPPNSSGASRTFSDSKVVSYHSQVLFDPDRLIEIFVLDPAEAQAPSDPQA